MLKNLIKRTTYVGRHLVHQPTRPTATNLILTLYMGLAVFAGPFLHSAESQKPMKLTVTVIDPASSAAKRLPKGAVLHNGSPLVSLPHVQRNTKITLLTNSLLILHGDQVATYTSDHPEVFALAAGIHHYPSGVQGLFQAKKPGTATLNIIEAADTPVCPPSANECLPNWSGYSRHAGAQPFTGIAGQWTVPTLAPNSPPGESSTWVGLGGDGTDSLIQAGTYQIAIERDNPFDDFTYHAFYELFPDPPINIESPGGTNNPNTYATLPGDVVKVQIVPSPGAPIPIEGHSSSWSIQISNVTQKWNYQTTVQYGGALNSAEWIIEAPKDERGQTQMADYQEVEFNFDDQVAVGGGPLLPPNFKSTEEVGKISEVLMELSPRLRRHRETGRVSTLIGLSS